MHTLQYQPININLTSSRLSHDEKICFRNDQLLRSFTAIINIVKESCYYRLSDLPYCYTKFIIYLR